MKLFTIHGSVDDCEKGVPSLKADVVHVKYNMFSCVQT